MSAQVQVQPTFWLDSDEQIRFFSRLKRALFLSLALHLVILIVVAGLRLPQRGERPLASVEVSLVSMPTPPVKQAEVPKRVETPKAPEPRPAPVSAVKPDAAVPIPIPSPTPSPVPSPVRAPIPAPVPAPVPIPAPVVAPARQSFAKDILRDLQLPPDAPKFGELTPAKTIAQPIPQQAAKTKLPELPRIPDTVPDRTTKTPAPAPSLSDELNRELEEELKKVKQYQPAAKLDIPKEIPMKPAPLPDTPAPSVSAPQTTLKPSGSSGTNPFWGRVEAIIKSNWEPPPIDVTGQPYSVIVRFRFYRNGTVKDVVVHQSSGNSYFDLAGQRAVQRPRQFPAFPAEMTESYQDVEMVFRVGEAVG